jgi:hypothetical protein
MIACASQRLREDTYGNNTAVILTGKQRTVLRWVLVGAEDLLCQHHPLYIQCNTPWILMKLPYPHIRRYGTREKHLN